MTNKMTTSCATEMLEVDHASMYIFNDLFVALYSNMEVIPYVDDESSKISKVIKMPSSSSNQHQQSQCPQIFNITCHGFFPPISVNIEYSREPNSSLEASPSMLHPTYCDLRPCSSALESSGVPFDGTPNMGSMIHMGPCRPLVKNNLNFEQHLTRLIYECGKQDTTRNRLLQQAWLESVIRSHRLQYCKPPLGKVMASSLR
jgi:hypothetical protein